ncbi:MAG: hypothetical protein ACP5Q1_09935 [Anaerolineae bacterium]
MVKSEGDFHFYYGKFLSVMSNTGICPSSEAGATGFGRLPPSRAAG